MGICSSLATVLDEDMVFALSTKSIKIYPSSTPDKDLDPKTGQEVSNELGKRYLLRYLLPSQVGLFRNGSDKRHCVTPTPYAPEETISWLALPSPTLPRTYVLVLAPDRIDSILGPRWIRLGKGIEYILPGGFRSDALALPWEILVT